MELVWTNKRPTEPGWYWLKARYWTPNVVEVFRAGDGKLRVYWEGQSDALSDENDTHFDGESIMWAGPIPQPLVAPSSAP